MRSIWLQGYAIVVLTLGFGVNAANAADTSSLPPTQTTLALTSVKGDKPADPSTLSGETTASPATSPQLPFPNMRPADQLPDSGIATPGSAHSLVAPDDLHIEEERTPRSKLDLYYDISTFPYSRDEHGPISSRWRDISDLKAAKRWGEALELLRLDLEESPEDVTRRLDYVQLLLQVGNLGEANATITAGLTRTPNHPLLRISQDGAMRLQAARTPNQRRSALLLLETRLFEARQIYMKVARESPRAPSPAHKRATIDSPSSRPENSATH